MVIVLWTIVSAHQLAISDPIISRVADGASRQMSCIWTKAVTVCATASIRASPMPAIAELPKLAAASQFVTTPSTP
ncbi:hypothetical protein D3C87_1394180 [compost metagenome]